MVLHSEKIKSFVPSSPVQFILMGTMVSINARTIDGIPPEGPYFYYNNNRNHFWKVLQHLLEPSLEPKKILSINEKKALLNHHGIAVINLVEEVLVKNNQKLDPSDTVLFESHKKDRIQFKTMNKKEKHLIETKPIFFTCRSKSGIKNLIQGFSEHNQLNQVWHNNIWFLATPTRCNPLKRSQEWKAEMLSHSESLKRVFRAKKSMIPKL